MSEQWKPGDLALCVITGDVKETAGIAIAGRRFKRGALYTVTRVGVHPIVGDVVLWLREDRSGRSAGAFRFRKVTPDEADAFDREVIEQMTGMPATAEGVVS